MRRFLNSIVETSSDINKIEVILYADNDDTTYHELDCSGVNCKLIIGPQLSMGSYNTRCLNESCGEIIMLVNDDVVIRTRGWDSQLLRLHDAIYDSVYLFYPNDLLNASKLCAFPIMSRKTIDILVNPYPYQYKRAFIDLHILDIFKRLENIGFRKYFYLSEIVFEHLHFKNNKACFDEVYEKREKIKFIDDDTFISLAEFRQISAIHLARAIASDGKTLFRNSEIIHGKCYLDYNLKYINGNYSKGNFFLETARDCNLSFTWKYFLIKKFFVRGLVRALGYNYKWYKWKIWY